MAQQLITIGITAYNAAGTIARAIEAARAQTWGNKDILIVDDASTDDTVAVIEGHITNSEHIRFIQHKTNKGVAAARNTLIDNATGEFIAFFDDDDTSTSDRLEKQYERLIAYEKEYANGAPALCHTARTQVYPDGTTHYEPTMGMAEDQIAPNGPDVALRILTGKHVQGAYGSLATCSQMGRIKTYRDLGGFDESFPRGEDTDFAIRLALAGGHFPGIAAPLVMQTMTRAADKKIALEKECALRLLDKHKTVIEKADSYAFCRRWLDAKYDYIAGDKTAFMSKLAKNFCRYPIRSTRRLLRALPNRRNHRHMSRLHQGETT